MGLMPFLPRPGLNSDDTSFTSQGKWIDGHNVRFVDGRPQVIGEGALLFSLAAGGPVSNIFAWNRSGTVNIAYGAANAVYIGANATSATDRTPVGMASGRIAFAAWGNDLLFSPSSVTLSSSGTLYEWTGGALATAIANAPDNIVWMLVTPQRQVLAFGCNEEVSGTFNSRCIRGSDLEDNTDWTTSATNNAFEHILDGPGAIVTARMVGDYVAVWTTDAIYLGQYIGDPSQTYRFDRMAGESGGICGPDAIAIVGQRAYWMGTDRRIRTWAPGGNIEALPCPIFRDLAFTFSAYAAFLVYVSKFNELRAYSSTTQGYIAVSLTDGAWSKGKEQTSAKTAALCSDLLYGVVGSSSNFMTAGGARSLYVAECGDEVTASEPASWYIQSGDFYLEESQRRVMIRGIRQDFKGQDADVTLTLYARNRPLDSPTTIGPFTLTSGTSKKDFRASGKIFQIKFSGEVANVNREMRIGKTEFDIVPLGER